MVIFLPTIVAHNLLANIRLSIHSWILPDRPSPILSPHDTRLAPFCSHTLAH